MYIGNDLQIAHPSYKIIDDISSGFNGSQTSFALQVSGATPVPFPISTQQVMISVNGVVQEPDPNGNAGFKLLGSNIVFSSAPANGHAFFGVINAGADYVTAGSEFPDGSATAPSFTFQDDQDTGWFRSGSGAVGYSANGVNTIGFDGNGLTVTGDATFTGDSSKNLFWDKSDGQLEFADNAKATFGTGSDLNIYHNGSHSVISNTTGTLFTLADNLSFKNNANDETLITAAANGAVELYHDNSKKLETTSAGITVTGEVNATGNLLLNTADNQKIFFGAGNDLQIYHDGTNTRFHNTTGDLIFRTEDQFGWYNAAGSESVAKFTVNGSCELYHDNSKKFETNSAGVKVTGGLEATGFLAVADNQNIYAGSDNDFYIRHNGTNAMLGNGTGDLYIWNTTGNDSSVIRIQAKYDEDSIRCTANGSVRVAYDNSTKLETTSTGINVTGVINVNGSPLSAAPEITGTASGAIAAHKPVIVHTDGTLKEVTQTVTPRASASIGAENAFKTQTLGALHAAYDSQSQTTVVLYQNSHFGQNPGIARIQAISYAANGTPTNGAQLDISWGANATPYDLRYDPTSECMLAFFNYNNESFFCSFTISGTTGTTESHDQIKAGATSSGQLCPCPAAGKLFVFNAVGNRTEGWAYTNVGTGTSLGSWTHGNGVYLNGSSTGSESYVRAAYHSDSGKVVVIYRDNNDSDRLKSRVVSYDSSNNRLTFANSNDITTSSTDDTALEYDPNANKLVAVYRRSSTLYFKIGTLSGTSISWGTERTFQANARYPKACYTSVGNQMFISYADSSNRWSYKYGVISGTDITIGTNAQGAFDSSVNDHDAHGGLAFDTKISQIVGARVRYNNSRHGSTRTAKISDAVSNLTTGFAGFSDAAYSNGATATIKVTGNTTTQSGLTAGTNYFVQNDGSLGTIAGSAATVEAGLALSSTSLLIKG